MNQECCPSFLDLIFLSLVLINMKVNKTFSKKKKFNTGSCVKGDWLSIDLSKFCDMICEKKKNSVCSHRCRQGEPSDFCRPLTCFICVVTKATNFESKQKIWFDFPQFVLVERKREKKKWTFTGASPYIALEDLLHSFFSCLSLTLHQPYSTIQPFQISILNSTPVLNSTMLDHTVSHAYDTFFSF